MTRVQSGYAITNVANRNSKDVEIDEAELEVTAIEAGPVEQSAERTVTVGIRTELRRF